jgi:tetratricopeptide (TPR) repeat protein
MDRFVIRRAIPALLIGAASLVAGPSASAETAQQRDWCLGKGGATREMQIAGCTAMITSGHHSNAEVADAFNTWGAAHAAEEEWDRALSDYSTSLQLAPSVAATFYNRGLAYLHTEDFDHAISDFDAALKLDPALIQAFNNRGIAWRNKGDFDRAIADYG